jgi:hypothetical protein
LFPAVLAWKFSVGWFASRAKASIAARCKGGTVLIGAQPRKLFGPEVAAAMDQRLAVVPDARGTTCTTHNSVDVVFVGNSPVLNLLPAIRRHR